MRQNITLLFFLCSLHTYGANLFVNGSFEMSGGPIPRLSTTTPPPGWFVPEGYGVLLDYGRNTGSYAPGASQGTLYYYIGDAGFHASIAQTVFIPQVRRYHLEFDLSSLIGDSWVQAGFDAEVDLTISNGTQTFLPGLTYDFVVNADVQSWVRQEFSFTPTQVGDYTFTFTTRGAANGTSDAAFIDNVTLTTIPESVPDTGGVGALLSACLVVLIGGARKFSR